MRGWVEYTVVHQKLDQASVQNVEDFDGDLNKGVERKGFRVY